MRVVVDTNVWLSALLWGGQPDRIFQLVELKQIRVISSEEILTELYCKRLSTGLYRSRSWGTYPRLLREVGDIA